MNSELFLLNRKINSDKYIVESVYKYNSKSYDAYYYKDGQLVDKIYFP